MDELSIRLAITFAALMGGGALACLPLYTSARAFFASTLWTKILWWVPIFVGFLAVLYGGILAAVGVVIGLLIFAGYEAKKYFTDAPMLVSIYAGVVGLSLLHLPLFSGQPWTQSALIIICFASAISDVVAFFAGNYFGIHKLPPFLNNRKSWEGVIGQLVGGVLGAGVAGFILSAPPLWAYGLAIGAASACGDLANSYVKRRLSIKDWGNSIPGHGGVLDRFSSLSIAIAIGYWLFAR